MAKNKTKRRSGINTQKIFKFVRLGALALPAVAIALQPTTMQEKIKQGSLAYFGFNPDDGSFKLERLARGWMPFAAATGVTYGIPKLAGMLRSF